ncbi:T9SS type A sorting domain-containing protein [Epilithonimonas mollis]|uniref:Por secretion system C-terminal sorting domain-containing protein n=1 Tax=Epilithonimonas mollis TaxID=216903 RepID=A0A1M6THA8_9FLAO|nr:T9SS type A sorting domain-containing protein [Epilithonimonas mollis]SHK56269.1 Por secretion system C-terminal sorting domain-containing protein [Epilithonimonas mollis]
MKKALSLFAMIMGLYLSAQINVNQGFETSSYAGFSYTSFYRSSVVSPCTGSYGATRNFWSGGTTGTISYVTTASNGGKLDVSFKYKVYVYGQNTVNGNLKIYYSVDGGNNFVLYDTINLNSTLSCNTWATSFPQGFIPTSDFRFRIEGNYISGDYNVIIDDIVMSQSNVLAVSDMDKKSNSVYPNPFMNMVFLNNPENVNNVLITDLSGRMIKTTSNVSKELKLNDLKAGIYLITINYKDGKTETTKIVKKQ